MKVLSGDSSNKKEIFDLQKQLLEKKILQLFGQLKDASSLRKLKKEISRKKSGLVAQERDR